MIIYNLFNENNIQRNIVAVKLSVYLTLYCQTLLSNIAYYCMKGARKYIHILLVIEMSSKYVAAFSENLVRISILCYFKENREEMFKMPRNQEV